MCSKHKLFQADLAIIEFLILMNRNVPTVDQETEIRRAFEVFDKDGSGTISAEELKAVMIAIGENVTEAEVDEMISHVDKDGNGSIDCE